MISEENSFVLEQSWAPGVVVELCKYYFYKALSFMWILSAEFII